MWGDVGGLPGSESGIDCAAVVGGIGGKAHTFLGNLEPCIKRGAVDCSAGDIVVDNVRSESDAYGYDACMDWSNAQAEIRHQCELDVQ